MTGRPDSAAASEAAHLGAQLLRAVFEAPVHNGAGGPGGTDCADVRALVPVDQTRRVAVTGWLRARTVLTLRTAAPVRPAFEAATAVTYQLHSRCCGHVLEGGCRAVESVLAAVRADLVGDRASGDRDFGAALAADPVDTVLAAAAAAVAVYVAVDGAGAGAVIAALRTEV